MTSNDGDSEVDGRANSKVARLIEKYDLGADYGSQLEERWTANGNLRESLRDLADRFNRRLLRAALDGADISTVDGEVDNFYRLLTDDNVSSGNRTEARGRLERNGINVDELERDFVTYQAIRSYLTDIRGAEYERDSTDTASRAEDVVGRLRSRTRSVAAQNLERLVESGDVDIGEFTTLVSVDVFCEECGTKYEFSELVESGACQCRA